MDDISGVFDGTFESGVNGVLPRIHFESPSGLTVTGVFDILHPVSGDRLDGVYTAPVTFGPFAEAGVWNVSLLLVSDEAGNDAFFTPVNSPLVASAGSLTVNNPNSDTHAPVLGSLNLSSPTLNLTKGPNTVTVTARFTDDVSGVFDEVFADGSAGSSPHIRVI